ncbi:MAG TPA: hypothetical protein VMH02_03340 [Verrucomicrobiae bacterium]|nr:hypothetical protein [Verrucomicrobiae bacterium]
MCRKIASLFALAALAVAAACSSQPGSNSPLPFAHGALSRAAVPIPMGTRPPFGAAAASASPQPPLLYWGGPIQPTADVYVVFWGFRGAAADPAGERARVTAFLEHLGRGTWLDTLAQYYQKDPSRRIATPRVQLRGVWIDTVDPVPASPTQDDLASEAEALAAHFHHYDEDSDYVVATPHDHNEAGFVKNFCAWHSSVFSTWTGSLTGSVYLAFTNLPYIPDAAASCGENAVNPGSAGLLDGVSIVLGHEIAESRSDPLPYIDTAPPEGEWAGWYDENGQEVADKCAWVELRNNGYGGGVLGTNLFPNQPLWSNRSDSCRQ